MSNIIHLDNLSKIKAPTKRNPLITTKKHIKPIHFLQQVTLYLVLNVSITVLLNLKNEKKKVKRFYAIKK